MRTRNEVVSRRVREISPSVTLEIATRARALRLAGEDVISFSAGELPFAPPEHAVEAARRALTEPETHRYGPAAGLPELREAVARKMERDSGLSVDPKEIVVANGAKEALFLACQVLLDPGDEVLLPAPYWTSYPEQVRFAGGVTVPVPTDVASGYHVGVEQLEAARTPRTKALVLTSPSNPTGAVYSPEEVEAIGRWAQEVGLWVVVDEIYEHLVYGGARHVSMATVVPELREQCVVVNGISKTYAMTGWRVGWAVAPEGIAAAMAKLQGHLCSGVSNVAQVAALAALEGPQDAVEEHRETLDGRRLLAHERLDGLPGFECPLSEGAFYLFPSVKEALGHEVAGRQVDTSLELCEALLEATRVALVPGEAFGAPGHLRLSFAVGDRDLKDGLDRVSEALAP